MSVWLRQNVIGSGEFGRVYAVRKKDSCALFAAKEMIFDPWLSPIKTEHEFIKLVQREIDLQTHAALLGFALQIVDSWVEEGTYTETFGRMILDLKAVCIMEKADHTVKQLIQSNMHDVKMVLHIIFKCVNLMQHLYDSTCMIHGDCHMENIMYIVASNKFVLIDFHTARYDKQTKKRAISHSGETVHVHNRSPDVDDFLEDVKTWLKEKEMNRYLCELMNDHNALYDLKRLSFDD